MKITPIPKPGKKKKKKRKTDEQYIKYIEAQPCIVCHRSPSDAHHEPLSKTSGIGMKGPDRETIPLCREHHTERHQIGRYTFAEKYNLDYGSVIKDLQGKYKKLIDTTITY